MPPALQSTVRRSPIHPAWPVAQRAFLVGTALFALAVAVAPELSLRLFWGIVVPLLPLSFFITPLAWRSVCPLATLNVYAQHAGGPHQSSTPTRWAGAPAMIALTLLVPARHFAFNTSGVALLLLVVGASALAIAFGMRAEARAGFCNAFCPVLPVELLYGMQPVVSMGNARCSSCDVCTPRGCMDLAGNKALAQLIGPRRRALGWLLTAYGIFAAAFPGFVIGYFTTSDIDILRVDVAHVAHIYAHILAYSAASYAMVTLLLLVTRVKSAVALPVLASVAGACYYWFAIPVMLRALSLASPASEDIGRVIGAIALAWWLRRAVRLSARSMPSGPVQSRALPVLSGP